MKNKRVSDFVAVILDDIESDEFKAQIERDNALFLFTKEQINNAKLEVLTAEGALEAAREQVKYREACLTSANFNLGNIISQSKDWWASRWEWEPDIK